MQTQIDSIATLLDARTLAEIAIGGVVEAHPAGEVDFFSTLMRHEAGLPLPIAASLLAGGVRELALARPLVLSPRLPQ